MQIGKAHFRMQTQESSTFSYTGRITDVQWHRTHVLHMQVLQLCEDAYVKPGMSLSSYSG